MSDRTGGSARSATGIDVGGTFTDLAVLHAAWAFPPDGRAPLAAHSQALFEGYQSVRSLGTPTARSGARRC